MGDWTYMLQQSAPKAADQGAQVDRINQLARTIYMTYQPFQVAGPGP